MQKVTHGSIIGIGGLGCPALVQLIENWFPNKPLHLQLIDPDVVELSNLNRQILFSRDDLQKSKSECAHEKIKKIVSPWRDDIHITHHKTHITTENIHRVLSSSNFILDCTDDIPCKLLLNSYARIKNKILVYAGVQGTQGVVQRISGSLPCLHCSFGEFTEIDACELGGACRSGGVIGTIAGITAMHQVDELLKALEEATTTEKKGTIITINDIDPPRILEIDIDPLCPNLCGCNPRKKINLSHLTCPKTFLFAKLALEQCKKANYAPPFAEIIFSSEDDLKNVSHSLEQEGNKILHTIVKPEFEQYAVICSV